jgi:hypothetical protein
LLVHNWSVFHSQIVFIPSLQLINSNFIEEENIMLSDKLFTEVTSEESATVSGGGFVTAALWQILSTASFSPGGAVVTPQENHTGYLLLLNMIAAPGTIVSP